MKQEELRDLKKLLDKASNLFGVDASEVSVKSDKGRYILRVYDRDANGIVSKVYKYENGEKSIVNLEEES